MINMDFNQRVVINTRQQDWQQSPRPGVLRKPLAREEAERGHATSIVRYVPGASFSAHDHPQGEEILVLEGTFSDETGHYHAGTYFRNPEGFRHAPFSKEGCVILVKLHQFQPADDAHLSIDTKTAPWLPGEGQQQVMHLHEFNREHVALVKSPAGEQFPAHEHPGGEEIYVISGELVDEFGRYPQGTWLRNPAGSRHQPHTSKDSLLWVKTGHLPVAP